MEVVTKKPNVPALRFPEFSGEWEKLWFKELFLFSTGKNIKQSEASPDYETPCVRYGELYHMYNEIITEIENRTSLPPSDLKLSEGDEILLPSAGEDPMAIGSASALLVPNVAIGRTINILKPKGSKKLSTVFVSFLINQKLRKRIAGLAKGVSISNVYNSDLRTLIATIPSMQEQEKVAAFLTVVDERFGLLKRKKELLEEYKKGVMQRLFSQEIRFKDEDGDEYPEWEEKRLGEVLFEHKEKSNGTEQVHSVSVHKGVINQIEHLGRSFAASNTDNYNRVYPGDIIYTKSPTGNFPFGIIKRNQKDEEVIVSPLYGVFTAESPGLAIWLDEFFSSEVNTHNYLSSIIQKGAKNTINITNRTFLSKSILVPVDSNEQDRIGQLFGALNDKIQLVTSEIEALSKFKRGLLQKMFV